MSNNLNEVDKLLQEGKKKSIKYFRFIRKVFSCSYDENLKEHFMSTKAGFFIKI